MITKNKERIEKLFREKVTSERNAPKVEKLLSWLEQTDFYVAPASTRFHEAYDGGLAEHSLNVYDKLVALNKNREFCDAAAPLSEESMVIMAICHDFCKINFYKKSMRNKKNEQTGRWEQVPYYEVEDQFPYGHGEKSVELVSNFFSLSMIEKLAIRWHMSGFDNAVKAGDYSIGKAYEYDPRVVLLALADMGATYLQTPPNN